MAKIQLQTAKKVVPIIYCYTTPEIARHDGWVKIGYSEQEAATRVDQQTHTADVEYKIEWSKNAAFDDGSGDIFHDSDFHAYLTKCGVERKPKTEWFHITPAAAKKLLDEFRENRGILQKTDVIQYRLRNEQAQAVEAAKQYFEAHTNGAFLYNAKPRFGKTLTVYDLCKQINAVNVLIVTNRPAIANSWYEDYCKFLGTDSGYYFVSWVDALKGKPYVLSRSEYSSMAATSDGDVRCIQFMSLQDLKGSIAFGGKFDKHEEVGKINWDLLVIDEAHEGVDTYKTDVAFDHIKRKNTLHLSGTPFKALANDKFSAKAIFNWTYADEQKAKAEWKSTDEEPNPYENLPQLNMYTYKMSDIIRDKVSRGVDIEGDQEAFFFDLNEFFSTVNGRFVHVEAVDKFLDAMTTQEKFPFSTDELRGELKHTLWLLNRVDSAKALASKLEKHPVFGSYKIIIAAGDGLRNEEDDDNGTASEDAFKRVTAAIAQYDKTITLSVGQLTTGVTIPEWTAVFMLSSIKSPALYMQAAFRAQNPCLFSNGHEYFRKKNAYVFDFDPARTLIIFEEFANDLCADTSSGRGDTGTREEHVRELLNFFPVIGEDDDGEMILLDAAQVLSIPRKIKSQEVVRHGFMSDFLFQNIHNVFHAPQEVIDIITAMDPAKDPGAIAGVKPGDAEDLNINDEGEIELPDELVIGTASKLFGEKIYDKAADAIDDVISNIKPDTKEDSVDQLLKKVKSDFHEKVTDTLIKKASEEYGVDLSKQTQRTLERKINSDADAALNRSFTDLQIEQNRLENDRKKALSDAPVHEHHEINKAYDKKKEIILDAFKQQLSEKVDQMVHEAGQEVVRSVEIDKREQKKRTVEDSVRDHLRGFSRTIPSFLMAYGTENVTLESFDKIIPDEVFREVTSITLDQFRFLRDGGDYKDEETGEMRHYEGKLFDPIVFNDSVKEFLRLKRELADYFDEASTEDIFDYIPPQKTNQIFTPRTVVKDMVDRLEEENPGCYDDPDKTFADLYMKSGMYITEIVKRLYQSERMKMLYPDNLVRLNHIFERQVYGLAPTEIIYRICLAYILGFSDDIEIKKHNIRLCDSLKYAKEGTLEEKLLELFGDTLKEE